MVLASDPGDSLMLLPPYFFPFCLIQEAPRCGVLWSAA